MITYERIKWASFTHSGIYAVLLLAWAIPGLAGVEFVFGLAHGLGWFAMCALAIEGLRRRVLDVPLAVAISVLGAIGPFIGSAAFWWRGRVKT